MLSVVLLLVAELSWCYELFVPVPRKKSTDSKATKLLPALIQSIQNVTSREEPWQQVGRSKGKKASKEALSGYVGQAFHSITTVLANADAFAAAYGLATVAALASALGLVTYLTINRQGVTKTAHNVFTGLLMALPVATLCGTHVEILTKAWKALLNDKLIGAAYLPLKVLALLFARPPTEEASEDRMSTPGLFSALQAASLTAVLSADIARGSLGVAILDFWKSPRFMMIDSELFTSAVPICVGLGWLSIVHLQRRPASLFLCMLLTIVASPLVISAAWPKAGEFFGLASANQVGPEHLSPFISVAFAMIVAMVCFSGGSMGLVVVMGLGQLLMRAHGIEALGLG